VLDSKLSRILIASGLRLSELVNIRAHDVDWKSSIVRVIGKGNKEGYAPFGERIKHYLKLWMCLYQVEKDQRIWDIGYWGMKTMLDDLKRKTGLPCNPHTFRRTFACLLRKAGVDTMTIKDLGRWESLEMLQRYTRSVTPHDSLQDYTIGTKVIDNTLRET